MLIFHTKYDREHFLCQKLPVKSFLHHREWKVHMNRLTWIKTGETSCRHWLADWASLIFITQSSETITESLRWICHRDYFTSCQYQQPQVASDCLLRVKTWIHYRWKHLHVYWREQSTQVSEVNIKFHDCYFKVFSCVECKMWISNRKATRTINQFSDLIHNVIYVPRVPHERPVGGSQMWSPVPGTNPLLGNIWRVCQSVLLSGVSASCISAVWGTRRSFCVKDSEHLIRSQ